MCTGSIESEEVFFHDSYFVLWFREVGRELSFAKLASVGCLNLNNRTIETYFFRRHKGGMRIIKEFLNHDKGWMNERFFAHWRYSATFSLDFGLAMRIPRPFGALEFDSFIKTRSYHNLIGEPFRDKSL